MFFSFLIRRYKSSKESLSKKIDMSTFLEDRLIVVGKALIGDSLVTLIGESLVALIGESLVAPLVAHWCTGFG